MTEVEKIIKKLGLETHPEGGYFLETYRSEGIINLNSLKQDYPSERNYSTSIYYLLTSDAFSAFHKIRQDEIWHFYDGAPIHLHVISSDGDYQQIEIGKDILNGQIPQYVVKGGDWFAATVKNENSFSLAGCTVSPGFDFSDFELANTNDLTSLFPQHEEIIKKLTR